MVAGLAQVLLQAAAVAPARRHRDLRLQHAHQAGLARMGLVEVLEDLLVRFGHALRPTPACGVGTRLRSNANSGHCPGTPLSECDPRSSKPRPLPTTVP